MCLKTGICICLIMCNLLCSDGLKARSVEQEIRLMEGLRHPNIVKLLGFNVSTPYIVQTMNTIELYGINRTIPTLLR